MSHGARYPIFWAAIDRMIEKALMHRRTVMTVVRIAGVRAGSGGEGGGDPLGAFTLINGPDGFTYNPASGPFPGDASMTRLADLTDKSEIRLIANVLSGGEPDLILTVSGAGEDASVVLEYISGEDNLVVGTWHPVSEDGVVSLTWSVDSPTGASVTLGLLQLQAR